MFSTIEKTVTLVQCVFWCGILFYFLWNTVWILVEQNIEHILFTKQIQISLRRYQLRKL